MKIHIGGREMECSVATRPADSMMGGRESKAVTVALSYAEAVSLFADDADWSVTADMTDDTGNVHQVRTDMSAYAISGPIIDNRDGTVTVRMGKYREEELMRVSLASAPETHGEALVLREIIEEAAQSIQDDTTAVIASGLYPEWAALAAKSAEAVVGMRFRHSGGLYKVRQAHTFAAIWIPGTGTEALYERIDETHAGTLDDPIPYGGNMALTAGMHYTQDGVVYLCTRDTVNAVYNDLADLTGLYVEAVS